MEQHRAEQPPTEQPSRSARQKLAGLVLRLTDREGVQPTAIPALSFLRATAVSEPLPALYEPSLYVIAQGAKIVTLGEESYMYDTDSYLVASVRLPIMGQIIEASPERPYLCVKLRFTADQIIEIMQDLPPQPAGSKAPLERGLVVSRTSPGLLDAVTRLVSLLDTPEDIPFLAPLVIREILYRVLQDEHGQLIRQLAVSSGNAESVSKAIALINQEYAKPLRIDELAKAINLSPSALHHQFKQVTAMSPLQYQKKIRLQEARRLLIAESLEAADASYQVGYESPSQFSREYARMFGLPPISDIKRLKDTVGVE